MAPAGAHPTALRPARCPCWRWSGQTRRWTRAERLTRARRARPSSSTPPARHVPSRPITEGIKQRHVPSRPITEGIKQRRAPRRFGDPRARCKPVCFRNKNLIARLSETVAVTPCGDPLR
eukprot:299755-Prorocentrum_minimum.AAC.1